MPTSVVTANTTAQTAFTVPTNKIGRITFIEVDNRHTADITITIQDTFTPTATVGNPSPSAVTVTRKKLTVRAGTDIAWDDETESIEILGTCKVLASVTSTDCDITIGYKLE